MSKLQRDLNKVVWKPHLLSNIFGYIGSSIGQMDKNRINNQGMKIYPYVTRTENNNGIESFIPNQKILDPNNGNVIIIGLDTQTVFYQKYPFYTGQNIQVLSDLPVELTESLAMFLITSIKPQLVKFNWGGNGATLGRLRKLRILLPTNNKDEPDWEFMECFMKYIETKVSPPTIVIKHSIKDYRMLDHLDWKEFKIEELFNIEIGKSIDGNKVNKEEGYTPYITRKESLNGVDGFIDWLDESYLNKVETPLITIGNETAQPFVQTSDFYTGTKVNIMRPIKEKLNLYHMLFVKSSIEMNKSKYSYSYTINSTRLKKQKIMLPIDIDGKPDWKFMEQYMMRMENELMEKVNPSSKTLHS